MKVQKVDEDVELFTWQIIKHTMNGIIYINYAPMHTGTHMPTGYVPMWSYSIQFILALWINNSIAKE